MDDNSMDDPTGKMNNQDQEALETEEIDPEFLEDFIAEAREHLETIEMVLLDLESSPDDSEKIHSLFRSFHTIKGLAGFVNYERVRKVAHLTESLLDDCRKGKLSINQKCIDVFLESTDWIKRLCDTAQSGGTTGNDQALLGHLSVLETMDTTGTQAEAPPPEEAVAPPNDESIEPSQEKAEELVQNETAVPPQGSGGVPRKIGEILVERGAISDDELVELLAKQEESPDLKFGQVLVKEKAAEAKEVIESLRQQTQPTQDPSSPPSRSSSDSASVRIPAAKVDALVDMLGELLITQSLAEQETAHRFDRNDPLVNHLMRMGRLTRDIQYRAMALRMISLKPTFQKVARVGRDAINRLQKDVALTFAGEETEIDRSVAEKMIDPLLHLVKNSVSHGIEDDPAKRQAQGKPPTGQVRVAAESRRGSVYITVADDGRGIDLAKVQQRAQERGLIDPSASPSDEEILDCLFQPGFSTAEQVTSVSGRGVGLDVVKTEIARLGGRVELANHPGEGSTFTLKIPINLAVLNGTVVEIAGSAYILPTVNVQKIVHGAESAQGTIRNQAAYVRVREHLVPLVSLARLLGITQPPAESPLFIVLELENRTRALPVDRVIGRQEIVVKSLGTEFSHLSFVAGASILGDGQVALILDIEGLFREKVG